MNKEFLDTIIDKIAKGFDAVAKTKDEVSIILGDNVLNQTLKVVNENNPDLFSYVIEQLIIKSPESVNALAKIVKAKYPEHTDHLEKLIILI